MPAKINLPQDEIINRYRAGETVRELGKAYGVSYQTIANRLKAWGIQRRPSYGVTAKYDSIAICTEYWLGASIPEILSKYGMEKSHLYKMLKKHKVPMRVPHNRIGEDRKEGVRL